MSEEVWKDIPGFEGAYQVSDHGNVRSLDRRIVQVDRWGNNTSRLLKGRRIKLGMASNGYAQVHLYKTGVGSIVRNVAPLVAEVFICQRPKGLDVCHNDGVRTNNRASNLRYDTKQGNCLDRVFHGTHQEGENHKSAKLTAAQVREIRKNEGGLTHELLALRYGTTRPNISYIIEGKSWKSIL